MEGHQSLIFIFFFGLFFGLFWLYIWFQRTHSGVCQQCGRKFNLSEFSSGGKGKMYFSSFKATCPGCGKMASFKIAKK